MIGPGRREAFTSKCVRIKLRENTSSHLECVYMHPLHETHT